MQPKIWQSKTFILLVVSILAIFVGRTLLVEGYNAPLLSDIVMGLVVLGAASGAILLARRASMRRVGNELTEKYERAE